MCKKIVQAIQEKDIGRNVKMAENYQQTLKRIIMVLVGTFIYSIGVNGFLTPFKLLSGGVAGISLIIQYATGMPSGYFVLLLNIPIFLVGIKLIDKEFAIMSALGMASMSLFLVLTKNLSAMHLITNPILGCLAGGVISGMGSGIVFKNKGSEGGTDIISVIMKKKYGISIGNITFLINMLIVAAGTLVTGSLETAVLTLVCMYIKSAAIDKFIEGFSKDKMLLIITQESDKVKEEILQKLGRGVTFLYGEGAYTGQQKKVIYCTLSSKELVQVKEIVQSIDNKAFISVIDACEVQGKGFKPAIV